MEFNNKTLLILCLTIGGVFSLYCNQSELAYAIFGGLVGYLSKDYVSIKEDLSVKDNDESGSA